MYLQPTAYSASVHDEGVLTYSFSDTITRSMSPIVPSPDKAKGLHLVSARLGGGRVRQNSRATHSSEYSPEGVDGGVQGLNATGTADGGGDKVILAILTENVVYLTYQ